VISQGKEPEPRQALGDSPSYPPDGRKEREIHGDSVNAALQSDDASSGTRSFGIWSYARRSLRTLHLTNWMKHKAILGAARTAQELSISGEGQTAQTFSRCQHTLKTTNKQM